MHAAAYNFVKAVLEDHPPQALARVLDIGSLNVNGTVRDLFPPGCYYHGIDLRPGDGVDHVIACADHDGGETYDMCVSTETLEHMREPRELLDCAWRALKPGGRIILTMAAPFRVHHGVDGGALGSEFYQNITPELLAELLEDWQHIQTIHNAVAHDLYATATRPARRAARKP